MEKPKVDMTEDDQSMVNKGAGLKVLSILALATGLIQIGCSIPFLTSEHVDMIITTV